MLILLPLATLTSAALAIWLATTGYAIYALPLVILVAALARSSARLWTGRSVTPRDMPPARRQIEH